jgi:hypothetical protein
MTPTTIDTPRTAKHERWGFLCGAIMALGASLSFAAARAGILGGLLAVDMIFARFIVAGLIMLPLLVRFGARDLAGLGWRRALILTLLRGAPFALGEIVTVIRPNGAGKTTMLNAAIGLLPWRGRMSFEGADLSRHDVEARIERGFCLVPEKRELFGDLSIADNLLLGGYARRRDAAAPRQTMANAYLPTCRTVTIERRTKGAASGAR